jgi:hypothetical protein
VGRLDVREDGGAGDLGSAPYALSAKLCSAAGFDLSEDHAFRALAGGINASLLLYALSTFVGWRDSAADIVPEAAKPAASRRLSPASQATICACRSGESNVRCWRFLRLSMTPSSASHAAGWSS